MHSKCTETAAAWLQTAVVDVDILLECARALKGSGPRNAFKTSRLHGTTSVALNQLADSLRKCPLLLMPAELLSKRAYASTVCMQPGPDDCDLCHILVRIADKRCLRPAQTSSAVKSTKLVDTYA